jgi:hypothetical protein
MFILQEHATVHALLIPIVQVAMIAILNANIAVVYLFKTV